MGGCVALQLGLKLFVGQADRGLRAAVGRIGVGVDQGPREVRVVVREFAGRVVVLGRDRVNVLIPAAVMGEVFEVLIDACLVTGRVGGRAHGVPVDRVVRV